MTSNLIDLPCRTCNICQRQLAIDGENFYTCNGRFVWTCKSCKKEQMKDRYVKVGTGIEKLSDIEREDLVRLWNDPDVKKADIVRKYGVSQRTLTMWVSKLGKNPRRNPVKKTSMTQLNTEKRAKLIKDIETLRALERSIQKEYGASCTTLKKWISTRKFHLR